MTDTPNPHPDDALEPGDDFDEQKEQVDKWLDEEKEERDEREERQGTQP